MPALPTPATDARLIPCAHLIETDQPTCHLGYAFPRDCAACPSYSPGLNQAERTRCEVWTRVMGYHRPVSAFNAGKQAEHRERKHFVEHPAPYRVGEAHD